MKLNLNKAILVLLILIPVLFILKSLSMNRIYDSIYNKDALGFIYHENTQCGWIGGCSSSYKFIGEHALNFKIVKDGECVLGKGYRFHLGDQALPFKTFERLNDSDFFNTDKGVYYDCFFTKTPLDVNSMTIISKSCAIDNKITYCYGRTMQELNPHETKFINGYFAITNNELWFIPQSLKVEGIDTDTFQYISMDKSAVHKLKDKNGTYYYDWTKEPDLKKL